MWQKCSKMLDIFAYNGLPWGGCRTVTYILDSSRAADVKL